MNLYYFSPPGHGEEFFVCAEDAEEARDALRRRYAENAPKEYERKEAAEALKTHSMYIYGPRIICRSELC